jgi:hypothetical protein
MKGGMALGSLVRMLCVACLVAPGVPAAAQPLAAEFRREVERTLKVPPVVRGRYAARLEAALRDAGVEDGEPQFFLLVDRSPAVQAAFLYWRSPKGRLLLAGAAPVSTGMTGEFEHFSTPLGVFAHTPAHPDFRAEGSYNDIGIRGYGREGMRVFDFGWVNGERGWGRGGFSPMRLQLHATDPETLEPLLGRVHSKGCIRISASLDAFLDRHGALDAEYEAKADLGDAPRVLAPDRAPTAWAGRYLVVIDSGAAQRPAWSPLPRAPLPPAGSPATQVD